MFIFKKIWTNDTKIGNCTPHCYTLCVEKFFMNVERILTAPVTEILFLDLAT
jgi:hypothetical protein